MGGKYSLHLFDHTKVRQGLCVFFCYLPRLCFVSAVSVESLVLQKILRGKISFSKNYIKLFALFMQPLISNFN